MSEKRWLAATIDRPDGTSLPFGPAEDQLGRVLTGTEWSSGIPGGWGTGMLRVTRPDGIDGSDIPLLAPVRLYGPGNQTAYEGRVAAKPRVGVTEIEVELEGWVAHLEDDETFRALYCLRDLNAFGEMSVTRQLAHLNNAPPRTIFTHSTAPDGGNPALLATFDGTVETGRESIVEATLDLGPALTCAFVSYEFTAMPGTNVADTDWVWRINGADDDTISGEDAGSNLRAASGSGVRTFTTPKRVVVLQTFYDGEAGYEHASTGVLWRNLVLIGDHGLPTPDAPDGHPGVLAHDVIPHALANGAPLVTAGEIAESSFVMPDLAFREPPNTVRNVIDHVTALGGTTQVPNDWGVYEDRKLFWLPPGSYGNTWQIRKDEGAEPTDEGEDAEARANGLMLSFTDAAGNERTVGPPDSGADIELETLADDDPLNPVNAAGIPQRWRHRDGGLLDDDTAEDVARLGLFEANRTARKGSVKVPGPIRDSNGNEHPPWMLRGGDRSVEEDEANPPSEYVISTQYQHDDSYSVTANIGQPPNRFDVLLAQLRSRSGG